MSVSSSGAGNRQRQILEFVIPTNQIQNPLPPPTTSHNDAQPGAYNEEFPPLSSRTENPRKKSPNTALTDVEQKSAHSGNNSSKLEFHGLSSQATPDFAMENKEQNLDINSLAQSVISSVLNNSNNPKQYTASNSVINIAVQGRGSSYNCASINPTIHVPTVSTVSKQPTQANKSFLSPLSEEKSNNSINLQSSLQQQPTDLQQDNSDNNSCGGSEQSEQYMEGVHSPPTSPTSSVISISSPAPVIKRKNNQRSPEKPINISKNQVNKRQLVHPQRQQ